MTKSRDDFPPDIIEALAKRASYVCSNPDCRSLTLGPSDQDPEKFIYVGIAAHITAASARGPRYDPSLTPEARSSIGNGIFLCAFCATMIDKNKGLDFPTNLLKEWKARHEDWVRNNLNKSVHSLISTVDGEHHARGRGEITGLDAQEPIFIRPGAKVTAEGQGNVTATRIGYRRDKDR